MTVQKKVDKNTALNTDKKTKANEDEMQAWLDQVHFGSCCSDPLESSDNKKGDKACHITNHDSIKK